MPALVSVVLDPGHDAELRALSLASLEAQTHTAWEVVDDLASATGEYVAFLDAADVWVPERLARLVAAGAPAVADRLEGIRGNGASEVFGQPRPTEATRMMFRREVLLDGGGIDAEAGTAWVLDFLLRNPATQVALVPEVGVRRRYPDRRRALDVPPGNHRNAVLNRHLVDWSELASRPRVPGLTSVVVPTYDDAEMTTACIASLVAAGGEIEVLVWDNGSVPEIAAALDTALADVPGVRLLHAPENYGFALGNNLGFAECAGDVVVFLNNDTTVPAGWLAPLRAALDHPEVLGVQPLLVYPTGAIQSAGVAFPTTGGLPHTFLQGFPVEDAAGIDDLRFHALTGAGLVLRADDVVALRGFDPVFTNGMEDVDLCQRLETMRPGFFRVVTEAPVVHFESRTPGRYLKHLANRAVYLERWAGVAEPGDDVDLWGSRGLTVVDHRIAPRKGEPEHLAIPQPVLARAERASVTEHPRRLRWAIKNPAPAGEGGERWGDTHFASSLAAALRGLGQDVAVDRRPEWDRTTGAYEDVALVLRGLHAHEPAPGQVTIAWVISHPGDVTPEELRGYDRVAAASRSWADRVARDWGILVEPLLQATDPALFHPHDGLEDTGHGVLFVGNSRRVLRPVVRDALAAGLPLAVYGDLWDGLVPDGVVVARSIPNAELSAAYAAAGVVLNDHWDDMREQGFVSNRLFDAVASGARVVSDEVAGLAGLFGDSVQTYREPAELARLAGDHEVFGGTASRRATAERVRREHSFAARAETLVRMAHEARR